jgi:asparagine synthase (glutamine-hydrolysing)
MCDVSKDFWITFNGEIYNYIEIKQELEKDGFIFQNNTDTEVIIAAYKKYGPECLKMFNGMFAFALWDKRKETLFCARDRLGIKPFYYTKINNRFLFASEIKALLQIGNIPVEPDMESIYDYLSLGLMHYSKKTFFKHIYLLPAGSFMLLHNSAYTFRY